MSRISSMGEKQPIHHEIQPMSQRRKWVSRVYAETIGALGLAAVLAGGHEALIERDFSRASNFVTTGVMMEFLAGSIILKQFVAERDNKSYLEIQRALNKNKGLMGGLYYRVEEQKDISENMGLIKPNAESPSGITDIPDIFRNAFQDEDSENNPNA